MSLMGMYSRHRVSRLDLLHRQRTLFHSIPFLSGRHTATNCHPNFGRLGIRCKIDNYHRLWPQFRKDSFHRLQCTYRFPRSLGECISEGMAYIGMSPGRSRLDILHQMQHTSCRPIWFLWGKCPGSKRIFLRHRVPMGGICLWG